jgi:hypothetical protein
VTFAASLQTGGGVPSSVAPLLPFRGEPFGPRCRRPCGGFEPGRDLAGRVLHSITSSASNCIELETVRPSALAVLRLITNSNLVGCKTGRSAGFSPFRTRPV